MIFKEGGIWYHYTHVYRILHKWGLKQKVPRKAHVNTASVEEKEHFNDAPPNYCNGCLVRGCRAVYQLISREVL